MNHFYNFLIRYFKQKDLKDLFAYGKPDISHTQKYLAKLHPYKPTHHDLIEDMGFLKQNGKRDTELFLLYFLFFLSFCLF